MTDQEIIRKAAALIGRLGASKGGKARARAMTARQRRESARAAVRARWARVRNCTD